MLLYDIFRDFFFTATSQPWLKSTDGFDETFTVNFKATVKKVVHPIIVSTASVLSKPEIRLLGVN